MLERPGGGKKIVPIFFSNDQLEQECDGRKQKAENRGKNGREKECGDEGSQSPSTAKALVTTTF